MEAAVRRATVESVSFMRTVSAPSRKTSPASRAKKPWYQTAAIRTRGAAAGIFADQKALWTVAFLLVCVVFGGGPGQVGISFVAIALAGTAMLIATWRQSDTLAFTSLPAIVRIAMIAAVALPLVQLVPLPPVIWNAIAGHSLRIEVLDTLGFAESWMPLSIAPAQTAYSGAIAVLMFGLFVSMLQMTDQQMQGMMRAFMLVVLLATVIGIVQFASNGQIFRFYSVAHNGSLIGFFANKNHMGLLLACMIPLSYVYFEKHLQAASGGVVLLVVSWLAIAALLVATNSRAGVGLGMIAIFIVALRQFSDHRKFVLLAALGAGVLLATATLFVPALSAMVDRFGDSGSDLRFEIIEHSMPLMWQYGLWGSGLGSFEMVYSAHEPLEWVNSRYVNHAHNDFVQIVIEGGLLGVAATLLLAASIAMAWRHYATVKLPKSQSPFRQKALPWLGFVIIVLFAMHSIVDYPARRVATLVLLVWALALIFRPMVARRRTSRS